MSRNLAKKRGAATAEGDQVTPEATYTSMKRSVPPILCGGCRRQR